jgi:hypothetical protein
MQHRGLSRNCPLKKSHPLIDLLHAMSVSAMATYIWAVRQEAETTLLPSRPKLISLYYLRSENLHLVCVMFILLVDCLILHSCFPGALKALLIN